MIGIELESTIRNLLCDLDFRLLTVLGLIRVTVAKTLVSPSGRHGRAF